VERLHADGRPRIIHHSMRSYPSTQGVGLM
jgi:hypothetical protein